MQKSASESFLEKLLERAVLDNASDVHIEPFEDSFVVRLRTPAGLKAYPTPGVELYASLARTLKLLAKLDIAVEQMPQDGKFEVNFGGGSVEFRLASLPTLFGESFVLRVLDRQRIPLELDELGFKSCIVERLKQVLDMPYGLVAVVGATGSGKTTTLYAALRYLLRKNAKIVSIEDPVEYALEGVQQASVSERLNYPSALRAFLRHDPDVIFVGEIRDRQSAKLAVQAALTGHLVLTTLHTRSPQQSIARLEDLGVTRQLISVALKYVLAQKLESNGERRQVIGDDLLLDDRMAKEILKEGAVCL